MPNLYQCPDCHDLHEEPLDAAYLLAVRCEPCEIALAIETNRLVDDGLKKAA